MRNEERLYVAREMEERGYSYVGHRIFGLKVISSFEPIGLTRSVLVGGSASEQQQKIAAMQQQGWALSEQTSEGPMLAKLSFRYRGD